ncbi:hypothetical protein SS1G_10471 [Sclerotinia sclerotiorum 1980 UF-70]|uniref:Aminotransferase class I/classII large domain-containing protein n=1 Tax=Sclerotinia sclerotiorum (strain ATCC 18683 / 1980 / Ss-1) TaxID=665079 RepID=A7EYQ5_SCLS1|nr:hypothetical protein SS1G_10471 [Sclerotinia sclerotiorum 1980 UF-70]EDN94597.1 hypothetical protein SS1G_10471 [Sclerotinia sclerotiorum 1980 UF-70]
MEGDMSPLKELVQAAKEIFPGGNAQFIVDEAHSMGVVGEIGLGDVKALDLDSEIAIKTHTFSKAFGSIGGSEKYPKSNARKYSAFPVTFPVVPKGNARLRIVIHVDHTEEQIDELVAAICEWAEEMIEIEMGTKGRGKVPWAAQQVYALSEEGVINGDIA